MNRFTFDPRYDWKPRRPQREMQIGVFDNHPDLFGAQRVAKIIGPVEHAAALRAAAKAYCDRLSVPQDGEARVVVLSDQGVHAEARVVVNGRVVARCDAFDNGLNEAWARLIASCLNSALHALPVGDEVKP